MVKPAGFDGKLMQEYILGIALGCLASGPLQNLILGMILMLSSVIPIVTGIALAVLFVRTKIRSWLGLSQIALALGQLLPIKVDEEIIVLLLLGGIVFAVYSLVVWSSVLRKFRAKRQTQVEL